MTKRSTRSMPSTADRRAVPAVAAQFFVNGFIAGSVAPRLPEIRDQVDITAGRVGMLISLAGVAGLVGSALGGGAIERWGTRRTILVSGSVAALALPIIGFSGHQTVLALGLILMLGFDVPVDMAMNMQASWLSGRRRVPLMSRFHGLWSLGTVAGGVLASQLARSGVALSLHLPLASVLMLVVLVVIGRGLLTADELSVAGEEPAAGGSGEAGGVGPGNQPRADTGKSGAGKRGPARGLVLLGLAGYTAVTAESTSIDWAAFRFTDDLGATASQGALAYVAFTGGMTGGRLAGDWVAARLGHERMMSVTTTTALMALAAALLIDDRAVGLIAYLVAGLSIASFLPEIYDRAVKHRGRAGAGLGALTAGLRIAALTVPLLIGVLIPVVGSIGIAVAIFALPSVVGFAMVTGVLPRVTTARRAGRLP